MDDDRQSWTSTSKSLTPRADHPRYDETHEYVNRSSLGQETAGHPGEIVAGRVIDQGGSQPKPRFHTAMGA